MSVAASSPAWLTRRAEERKSFWACVRGLRLPLLCEDVEAAEEEEEERVALLRLLAASAWRVVVV